MSDTEEVIDLDDFYSVDSAFDECFKSLDNYQKERKELGGKGARNNLELMDFGSKIHENVNHLLDILLSEGNVNHLEKLKEMFVFIRNFGADVGMFSFTTEFNDGNDQNLLGKFKEFKGKIEEKFGPVKILEEIEHSIIPDAKKALCSSTEPEEQPWNIITEREIVDINNGIKSGFLPTYENKPSLWQRAKTFFTKTIPNFFRKVFGSTNSITKLNKGNSRKIFTDATGKAETQRQKQTNEIGTNIGVNSQDQTQQIRR